MTVIVVLWKDTFKVKHRIVETNQAGLRIQIDDIRGNFYCYVPALDGWIKPVRGVENRFYGGTPHKPSYNRKEESLRYEDMNPNDVPGDIRLYAMLLGL